MRNFEIKTKWITDENNSNSALEATLARVQILLGNKNVTEYKSGRTTDSALQIPTYYLAEWITENWWVVLFEPRKDEDADDSDFVARHSILAAQHGFALPALSIMPFGRSIRLNSAPRRVPYADIEFLRGASVDAGRDDVQNVLSGFVEQTIHQLNLRAARDSELESAWNDIKALTLEEREFCELVGSLGISPADVSDDLSDALARIYDILGARATRDFCLAATRGFVQTSIDGTEMVTQYLSRAAQDVNLASLADIHPPPEHYSRPSWLRGMQAAKKLRERFGIEIKDPRGADKLFDRLNIDTSHGAGLSGISALPFNGAIDRHDTLAKVALLQDDVLHRRFGAGRATYLAWVSEQQSLRLVTNAVTRDQQASRSFAAEILIPQDHLKALAGSNGRLHYDQVMEAARERHVMPDVAFKQAYNANIRVRPI
jgi:hypothetical protein